VDFRDRLDLRDLRDHLETKATRGMMGLQVHHQDHREDLADHQGQEDQVVLFPWTPTNLDNHPVILLPLLQK
jgi:hypothetical protein